MDERLLRSWSSLNFDAGVAVKLCQNPRQMILLTSPEVLIAGIRWRGAVNQLWSWAMHGQELHIDCVANDSHTIFFFELETSENPLEGVSRARFSLLFLKWRFPEIFGMQSMEVSISWGLPSIQSSPGWWRGRPRASLGMLLGPVATRCHWGWPRPSTQGAMGGV